MILLFYPKRTCRKTYYKVIGQIDTSAKQSKYFWENLEKCNVQV